MDLPPGPDMEVLGGGEDEWFSERNLADGTVPDSGQTTKSIQLPDGYRIDTGVAEHNWVYQGQR